MFWQNPIQKTEIEFKNLSNIRKLYSYCQIAPAIKLKNGHPAFVNDRISGKEAIKLIETMGSQSKKANINQVDSFLID